MDIEAKDRPEQRHIQSIEVGFRLIRVLEEAGNGTLFIHELEVGVKCMWKRLCFSSQAFTFACLCVA